MMATGEAAHISSILGSLPIPVLPYRYWNIGGHVQTSEMCVAARVGGVYNVKQDRALFEKPGGQGVGILNSGDWQGVLRALDMEQLYEKD